MRLTSELQYDATPSDVFAMLVDPKFQERKLAATGALEHDVSVETRADGGAVVRSLRTMSIVNLIVSVA